MTMPKGWTPLGVIGVALLVALVLLAFGAAALHDEETGRELFPLTLEVRFSEPGAGDGGGNFARV